MNNTNRFLIVRDAHGAVDTEAFFASSIDEAKAIAAGQAKDDRRWMICVVIDEVSP